MQQHGRRQDVAWKSEQNVIKPSRQDVTWKSKPNIVPSQEEYREDNQNLDAIKRLAAHFALPKSELMLFDGD